MIRSHSHPPASGGTSPWPAGLPWLIRNAGNLLAGSFALLLVACGGGGGSGAAPAGTSIRVTVTGLAAGLSADATLTGPGGYSHHLIATETLTGLGDGTYTLTAASITDSSQPGLGRYNGGTLGPDHLQRYPRVPVQTVTVSGGAGAASVDYPAATLTVQVPLKGAFPTTVSMDFVLVPAGAFTMGSDAPEDNAPAPHTVTFRKAFYMARTELTQAQWMAIMGANPSQFTGDTLAVETVSWDAIRTPGTGFLDQLNTALPGCGFRLPSEAEWEYACRAGTTTAYFFGADTTSLGTYAWIAPSGTQAVGTKAPNPWGLYDLAGNVWEWNEDDYHSVYTGAPLDGSAWVDAPRGANRVLRGGSSISPFDQHYFRSASRGYNGSDHADASIGFRVVVPVPGTP